VTAAAHELIAPLRKTNGLLAALRRPMARDELFAVLFILGCANGLMGRILVTLWTDGWIGLVAGDISWIVLFACFAGIWLLFVAEREEIRAADLAVGVLFLVLVALPMSPLSWVAVTGLALYILVFAKGGSARRRGAVILLALTIPMLWAALVMQLFSGPILGVDAFLAASLLGTERTGNVLAFGDGSGLLEVTPACSSFDNLMLGFLCFVTITQWADHRYRAIDLLWALLACLSVIAVNVIRIALTGLSPSNYAALHAPFPEAVAGNIILAMVVGFSLVSARRELFSRT
jgi:exosortase/archaeosortase family protein